MNIQQLNFQEKTAVTLFLLFVITATISSVILLGLELTGKKQGLNIPTVSQIRTQYMTPALVPAMKGSMYEHVTADEDIDVINGWIKKRLAIKASCTKMQQKS